MNARYAFWFAALGLLVALPAGTQDPGEAIAAGLASATVGPFHLEQVVPEGSQAVAASLSLAQGEDGRLMALVIAESDLPLVLVVVNDGTEPIRREVDVEIRRQDWRSLGERMAPPTPVLRGHGLTKLTVEVEPGETARYALSYDAPPAADEAGIQVLN